MQTPDLSSLLQRVESASGPDREIDAEVMFDLFAKPVGTHKDGGPRGYLWPDDNPSWSFGIRFPGKDRNWFKKNNPDGNERLVIDRDAANVLMNSLRIPPLTASVDAVLALIERELPGAEIDVTIRGGLASSARLWERGFTDSGDGYWETETVSWAPCALLSLLIRAKIAQQETTDA